MKNLRQIAPICAIALFLATGCSQEVELPPAPDPNKAPKATVFLRFNQSEENNKDQSANKAAMLARSLEKEEAKETDFHKLVILFFDSSGRIIGKAIEKSITDKNLKKYGIETTEAARKVVVFGNMSTGNLANVQTIEDLKTLEFTSLVSADTIEGKNELYSQRKGNLAMNSYADVTMSGNAGSADVKFHYMTAKISEINISWGEQNKGKYALKRNELNATTDKTFLIKKVFVLMAQSATTFLPNAGDLSQLSDWKKWKNYRYKPKNYSYTSGIPWDSASWGSKPIRGKRYNHTKNFEVCLENLKKNSKHLNEPTTLDIKPITEGANAGGETMGNILDYNNGYYKYKDRLYMHENNSETPTAIVVEVLVKVKNNRNIHGRRAIGGTPGNQGKPENQGGGAYRLVPRYFRVNLVEKDPATGTVKSRLVAEKEYRVNIHFKLAFNPDEAEQDLPGGLTPEGPPDPGTPEDISINVEAASWGPSIEYSKDF